MKKASLPVAIALSLGTAFAAQAQDTQEAPEIITETTAMNTIALIECVAQKSADEIIPQVEAIIESFDPAKGEILAELEIDAESHERSCAAEITGVAESDIPSLEQDEQGYDSFLRKHFITSVYGPAISSTLDDIMATALDAVLAGIEQKFDAAKPAPEAPGIPI